MAGNAKRNVLLITADQWRADCLSAVGHPTVKTPNLDDFACEAVLFRNHFTVCVPCGPSRASLLTGMYLQNHRSCTNGTPLDERHTNIALEARGAGYDPVLFGYTDTSRDPRHTPLEIIRQHGFEGVLPGFRPELLLNLDFEPWRQDLKAKGYDISYSLFLPERSRKAPTGRDGPAAGIQQAHFAPARFRAKDSQTALVTSRVIDYLKRQGDKPDTDTGWFIHASYLRPHPPFIVPEPYHSMYWNEEELAPPVRAADFDNYRRSHPWLETEFSGAGKWNEAWMGSEFGSCAYERSLRRLRATYFGLVSKVDHYIGELLAHLKIIGAYDNTLIIITSDHGEMLGDHWLFGKRGFHDQSYHIPLMIRVPGSEAEGCRNAQVSAFTESVDIMPTILDWLDLPVPRQCDGASLMPFLTNDGAAPPDWRTEAHWEYDFREITDQQNEKALGLSLDECVLNVIRDERYKYVHFAALPPLFFDRLNDPEELHNLADEPEYERAMLDYARKLLSWRMNHDERVLTAMKLSRNGVVSR